MTQLMEDHFPLIAQAGLNTNKNVVFGGNLTVTGTITGGPIADGATTITAASANALAVGPAGTTNPTLKVDTSTASAATGIAITSAAAASGVAIAAISSGTNESLTIDAKGSGGITINGAGTGGIILGNGSASVSIYSAILRLGPTYASPYATATSDSSNLTIYHASGATYIGNNGDGTRVSANGNTRVGGGGINTTATLSVGGQTTVSANLAMPAAGSAAGALLMSSTAAFGIYFGSGAPTVSAAQGSIYMRTDGSSSSTRMYVNSSGSTTWVAVTTAS